MTEARDKIIVALDVNHLSDVEPLVEELLPYAGCFKIGLELVTAEGAPQAVRRIKDLGGEVFLDGKFNDIPNTVAAASRAAAQLGVKLFNVHASAGMEAMKAAAVNRGNSMVFAVTVLTALDDDATLRIFGSATQEKVVQFARQARDAGLDGVICSPKELSILNAMEDLHLLKKITPGVRPLWAERNDQKRVATPADAIKAGAYAIVIGRPLTQPPPQIGTRSEAARKIVQEIEEALSATTC